MRTGSVPTGRPRIEELLVRFVELPLSPPLAPSAFGGGGGFAFTFAAAAFGDERPAAIRCRSERNTGCVQCARRSAMRDASNVHIACSTGRPTQNAMSGAPLCRHQARTVQSRETTHSGTDNMSIDASTVTYFVCVRQRPRD